MLSRLLVRASGTRVCATSLQATRRSLASAVPSLQQTDPEIARLIDLEADRQREGLELIASEVRPNHTLAMLDGDRARAPGVSAHRRARARATA